MNLSAAANQVLQSAVDSGAVPGVIALAADADGVSFASAFGSREAGGAAPMTLDTICTIASMTKLVACVAALQLVEQGKLELDSPIGGLLPQLAAPQVLEGFDAGDKPRLRPAKRPITLRTLLTHTAGFTYHMWNGDLNRYRQMVPGATQGFLPLFTMPLVFDPGERWEYGVNIDWAGAAVEQVSGLPLGEYMQQNIFAPLGMRDTGFTLTPEQRERLAGMHRRNADGSLTVVPSSAPEWPSGSAQAGTSQTLIAGLAAENGGGAKQNLPIFTGGGGLLCTGSDYLTFLRALLNGGRLGDTQILRPESVAELTKNQIGSLTLQPFKTFEPALSNDGEFFPGMTKQWSLGGMLTTEDVPQARSAGSLSWAGLFNTYYWLDPNCRIAGVVMTQMLPFLDAKVLDLCDRFERAVYAGSAVATR